MVRRHHDSGKLRDLRYPGLIANMLPLCLTTLLANRQSYGNLALHIIPEMRESQAWSKGTLRYLRTTIPWQEKRGEIVNTDFR